ncbi:MAG TPA: PepSY-associated TM helix domain-containing protein [Vicinamibacterales bacterium]|nr:PepSY-associated TM helix domain-containing protein [Vicinamibacterales bacterium]
MRLWRRWVEHPQRMWIRRAAFQIHLWTGIALGLYIVMLSVTGSALVYRVELDRMFRTPPARFVEGKAILKPEQLRAAAEQRYPGYVVTRQGERVGRRNASIEIWLEKNGDKKERLFNPYTGEDLGDAVTRGELGVIWLARLHDELLFDRTGKYVNGAGSAAVTLLVMTGAVVWWPGIARWRRSIAVNLRAGWKRINWDLHSAMGFWLFLFMLVWGVSGVYLGIPEPFASFVDSISDPLANYGERPGDIVLLWLTRLHFGRWRSGWLKAVWAIVGLVPAVMFVTGFIMWWNRSIRPWRRRERAAAEVEAT